MYKPSTTTTTNTTTTPLSQYFIRDFNSKCREVFGRELAKSIVQQAVFYARQIGEETVFDALDETAMAPRPSWRYTVAILANCIRDGVTCHEDYILRQAKFYHGD